MKVIIGGIPGVGKTTVLKGLKDSGITVENYGDIMFLEAKERGFVSSRDEIRKLSVDLQKEIQLMAARKISSFKDIVVDTHFSIVTNSGYLPGLPYSILSILNPDLLISIEADPLEIFERRRKDTERNRDKDTLEKIRQHLEANRNYGFSYSALTGAPLLIVLNEDGKAEEATRRIIEAIAGGGGK
ncbi:MAG: adenylate kinase [Thermoplasmatales archaeon]